MKQTKSYDHSGKTTRGKKNEPRFFFLLSNQINSIGSSPSKLHAIFALVQSTHKKANKQSLFFFITSVFLWQNKIDKKLAISVLML